MNKASYLAVPLLLVFSVADAAVIYNKDGNKLDLYGKISPRWYSSDNEDQNGDKTYVRIGVKAETTISDELVGYSRWERELKGNNPEGSNQGDKTRYAFAGLRSQRFGSLDYGRNLGVLYDIGAWTDMLPEFGSDTWTQNDVFMAKRTTGLLTWRNTDFFNYVDGLNLTLQYQGKNEANRDEIRKQNGDGVGAALTYSYGDISTGFTYATSARTTAQKESSEPLNAKGDRAEAWGTGIKYDNGHVYAAMVYSQTYNMTTFGKYISNETQNMEAVLQYQFDNGFRPSIAYLRSKANDISGYGSENINEYVSLGAFYYFTKNVSAIVDYRLNLLDENDFTRKTGVNTADILALGFTYAF
ncbi:Outer membrane porin protein OmpD [Klebsiella spallanzanii]|uniref:Outer membrane porin protein OmpD n=1 Tax=Klebsiella spallanzanii TaxID=2587528 RepID=A0ABY6V939_9ENTR|nr:porin [Klebsiella spallanzanii]VUS30664.1 Outer membrane porin protein OmpD [Klebsiella spallanzanii]